MEVVLIIALFIYLVITIGGINSKLKKTEELLLNLQKKINNLQKPEIPKESELKHQPKPLEVEKITLPIVEEKPIEIPKYIVEEKIIEKPTHDTKVVFTMEQPKPTQKPIVPRKSWWETFKENNPDLEKFIGENLINKIGILILVLGISYFVKYSIDKGWISEEARVGIGMFCGALVMGIAHKLKAKFAAFSSVFVAGAIAIFYFTIAIAFHDYQLFGQTTAFIFMVVITIFSCFISIAYNRKELAILSLIGGFAVPFMVSTGEGNYKVLFTYILILNSGILGIAYFKKWSVINILSFIFTILLFLGWFTKELNKEQPQYFGALVFVFLFYLQFILINIINNIKTKGVFSNTELSILSINTFLFYATGMVILNNYHPEYKGIFTTFLSVLNLVYAFVLYKKFGLDKKAVYLLIGLTLTFITLAIPIQFKGNYITLFWAAEGVLLLWLGQKSKMTLYKIGSVLVTVLMIFSLVMDWLTIYNQENLSIIVNKIFITGLFSIVSLFSLIYLLNKEPENSSQFGITFIPKTYSKFLSIIVLLMSYIVGFLEVQYQSRTHLISGNSSASIIVLYHLIFCGVLFYFLSKKNKQETNFIATIIGIANILLFTFLFSQFAFYENKEILNSKINIPVAFYLHYISLVIIIYFGIMIYKINLKTSSLDLLKNNKIVWIVSFLIIYLASTELMLHGLKFSIDPVTEIEVLQSKFFKENNGDKLYAKSSLIDFEVNTIRNLIIRTGFPILWGVLAFVFLIIGIKRKNKTLRIVALSLLGITILKLFLFDIKNASETGKIVAFILLGVLILIISFVYQKIKVLIIEEKPLEKNELE